MKKKLIALLASKQEERTAKMAVVDKSEKVEEVRALGVEIEAINTEIRSLEGMIADLPDEKDERTKAVNGEIPGVVVANANAQRENTQVEDIEKRMNDVAVELRAGKEVTITSEIADFAEKRSVASTGLLIENKYKREIADGMNEISQVIDLVTPIPLEGGTEYSVAFAIDTGDAGYSAEELTEDAGVYTNDEGTFGTNVAARAKITNSAIVNEEVIDLPNANYVTIIYNNVRKSIRKKISNQIIAGAGTTNTIKGIVKAPVAVMPTAYKVDVSTIGKTTLLNIVMGYGNDEDVTAPLTLFLNKKTLGEFAAVTKTENGDPFYKIDYNGPSGFIEGNGLRVPYSISSALPQHSTADDTTVTMVYGDPSKYELAIFGDITIKQSNERYIERGQVGFFGKTYVGGLVSAYKAFLPIKKA